MNRISYAKQDINSEDIKVVNSVLKSRFLTTGPKIIEFEKKILNFFGPKHAIAVSSATSALHISCLSLGLKKNDYLWTTSISFVASANCALYCGAKIDFVDIDSNNFNISIEKLEEKLKNTTKSKLPKIVIIVHLSGHPVDLKQVKRLSKKYKFKIIEDASHAAGSTYNGSRIGNCKYSDVCVFSFHPVKIITTGEGGAILTNSKKIFNKARVLRSHGIFIKKQKNFFCQNYDMKYLGFHYRMNEMQAALGISQLSRINKFVRVRNKISDYYKKNIKSSKIKFQEIIKNSTSSMHLFIIRLPNFHRNRIYKILKENFIDTNFHYIPIYRHSYYKKFKFKLNSFIESEKYFKEAITLPLYFSLEKKIQMKIVKLINKIVR
jgi:UDP-4-amino-4,6-dideoxy-N-acetyl-beta-L-altrosamine transaminase